MLAWQYLDMSLKCSHLEKLPKNWWWGWAISPIINLIWGKKKKKLSSCCQVKCWHDSTLMREDSHQWGMRWRRNGHRRRRKVKTEWEYGDWHGWRQSAKRELQTELELELPTCGLRLPPPARPKLPIYTLVEFTGSAETDGWGIKDMPVNVLFTPVFVVACCCFLLVY